MQYPIIHAPMLSVDGGFEVGETSTHLIQLVRTFFSWRLVEVPKSSPMTRDRSWCYNGTDEKTLLKAYVAAVAWMIDGCDRPLGWNKDVVTREWFDNGYYERTGSGHSESAERTGGAGAAERVARGSRTDNP